jgi:hypothetical protein
MDAGLVTPCAGSAAARKVWGLTLRPLQKTFAPHPDELLSSWLARLAAANYCDFVDLLAHSGVDSRHTNMLDFALETEAAERIAVFARTDVDRVQSLLFPVLTQTEAALIAASTAPYVSKLFATGSGAQTLATGMGSRLSSMRSIIDPDPRQA